MSMADSVSPRTNAISFPSGDHAADLTIALALGATRGRDAPPSAAPTDAPPRVRKRMLVPSGDQRGCVSTAVESSESGMVRPPPPPPPPTGGRKRRTGPPLPPGNATSLPPADTAGGIPSPGSAGTGSGGPTETAEG